MGLLQTHKVANPGGLIAPLVEHCTRIAEVPANFENPDTG